MRDGKGLLATIVAISIALLTGCSGNMFAPSAPTDQYVGECIAARQSALTERADRSPAAASPAVPAGGNWWARVASQMTMSVGDGQAPGASGEAGEQGAPPAHRSKRRGPAYPGDWLHSFGRDAKELVPSMWDDTKVTFTDPWTWLGLGAAGVVGIVTNATNADNSVADHYTKRGSQLSTEWDMVGDVGGNPGLHFAFAGAMYFTSLGTGDVKAYETSKTLINALAINGLTTLALKGLVRTTSPNGDPFGWPSGHTSSTFTLATVMHKAYGPWAGVPLFALASYVGYERIDARNHDFSDVLSGALIGIAIGHVVSQEHMPRILGFELIPWADANGGVGLALSKKF
ncbi:hypothetical protein LCGC14_1946810 [marine sediment metagenome]|uniref:Phosphatidic acid phosphatase type 2/haloperoxidase domain-containing protein n=1 Tax=marine sediment metagenome TaxID=412755 RepID=A0A0F9G730_9ZZZZ